MPKHAIDAAGEKHDVVKAFCETTGELYTHTRGGSEYAAGRHKIKVEAEIALTPEEVATVITGMSVENFAKVLHHLRERTLCWGVRNRTHLWQQVQTYQEKTDGDRGYAFVQELERWLRPEQTVEPE